MRNFSFNQENFNNDAVVALYLEDTPLNLPDPQTKDLHAKLTACNMLPKDKYAIQATVLWENEKPINVIFVSLGSKEALTADVAKRACYIGIKKAQALAKGGNATLSVPNGLPSYICRKFGEGCMDATYSFAKYKPARVKPLAYINITCEDSAICSISDGLSLGSCVAISRDLINEPANVMTPWELASRVTALGKENGFEVTLWDKEKIVEEGMGAYYAVAKGSKNPPYVIFMKYLGDPDSKEITGLVGKGLTYDSGGYSLKKTENMLTMKSDMSGGAAVIGTMCYLAQSKVKANVCAIIAACENMISGEAYKAGDVVTSMVGKTVEIINTDAEGRLTLIDAVSAIIKEYNPYRIIDVATLTGASAAALGRRYASALSNSDEEWETLCKASKLSGEKVWRMPLDDCYREMYSSNIADFKNGGGPYGGCITAGMLVGEFVQDKKWIHIDIAGMAFCDDDGHWCAVGATGFPVALLCNYINMGKVECK